MSSINKAKQIIFDCLNLLEFKKKQIYSESKHHCFPSKENDCSDKIYEIHSNEILYITIVNPGVNEILYPISLSVSTSFIQLLEVDKVKFKDTEIECDIFCQDDHLEKCTVLFFVNFNKDVNTRTILIRKIDEDRQVPITKIDKTTFILVDSPNYLLTYNFDQGFTVKNNTFEYKFKITHGYLPNEKGGDIRPHDSEESGSYIMAPSQINVELYSPLRIISQIYLGRNFVELSLRYLYSTVKIRVIKKDVFQGIFDVVSILSPKDYNPIGMEYLLVMQSNINNNIVIYNNQTNSTEPEFWTDENGMKMMRRIKDFRGSFNYTKDELIADNFYPVNSAISIRSRNNISYDPTETDYKTINSHDPMITIFNDRSQSGAALETGQLLLDLNRWSVGNDRRGLDENIREGPSSDVYFKVRHMMMIGNSEKKNLALNMLQKSPIKVPLNMNTHKMRIFRQNELNNLAIFQQSQNSLINKLIRIKDSNDNCFEIDFYHLDVNKTVIEFFNKNDPYFGKTSSCEFEFIMDDFPLNEVFEVSLNTLMRKNKNQFLDIKSHFLKKNYNDNTFSVQPQDFKTFIFSVKLK